MRVKGFVQLTQEEYKELHEKSVMYHIIKVEALSEKGDIERIRRAIQEFEERKN